MTPYHPQLRHLLINKSEITTKEFTEYEELETKSLINVQVHPEDYKALKKNNQLKVSGNLISKPKSSPTYDQQNQNDHERFIELRNKMPKYEKICRDWGKKQKRIINQTSVSSRFEHFLDLITEKIGTLFKRKQVDKKTMLKV